MGNVNDVDLGDSDLLALAIEDDAVVDADDILDPVGLAGCSANEDASSNISTASSSAPDIFGIK